MNEQQIPASSLLLNEIYGHYSGFNASVFDPIWRAFRDHLGDEFLYSVVDADKFLFNKYRKRIADVFYP